MSKKHIETTCTRMMPSHPDYPQVYYILTLLGMLVNPQAHFNTVKFMKHASTFPDVDQKIGEKERKKMIKELKQKLAELFENKCGDLSAFSEFIDQLEFNDKKGEAKVFEEKIEEFVASLNRIDLE